MLQQERVEHVFEEFGKFRAELTGELQKNVESGQEVVGQQDLTKFSGQLKNLVATAEKNLGDIAKSSSDSEKKWLTEKVVPYMKKVFDSVSALKATSVQEMKGAVLNVVDGVGKFMDESKGRVGGKVATFFHNLVQDIMEWYQRFMIAREGSHLKNCNAAIDNITKELLKNPLKNEEGKIDFKEIMAVLSPKVEKPITNQDLKLQQTDFEEKIKNDLARAQSKKLAIELQKLQNEKISLEASIKARGKKVDAYHALAGRGTKFQDLIRGRQQKSQSNVVQK
ncbi:hypothetical protein MIDIC_310006 [Alphaproteobacteria bacterium]